MKKLYLMLVAVLLAALSASATTVKVIGNMFSNGSQEQYCLK